MANGPLAGVLVLDLSRALAGPSAAMYLGDMGARVIKVEAPGHGDDSRSWGPPFLGHNGAESSYYMSVNRNKESVALDLKSVEGKKTIRALIAHADVLIENFRPGGRDKLGLSDQALLELNPRLVVLSITGFGHDGPEGNRPGYDQIAQGETGLMSLTGDPDGEATRIGVPICDVLAGVHGFAGVNAALVQRERTGRGCIVRTSLLAAGVSTHTFQGSKWTTSGEVAGRTGNQHPQIAPYGSYSCADGFVQLAVGSEALWRVFAPLVGLEYDDPRFADNRLRVANRAQLTAAVEQAFAVRPRADILRAMDQAGVPAGAIRTLDEVYTWDQTISQGLVIDVDHSTAGTVRLPGPPIRIESLENEPMLRESHQAPPVLGEHTEAVLRWLDDTAAAEAFEPHLVPAGRFGSG